MTTIDLRNCKPGDKLESRDGDVWTYGEKSCHISFPHMLINSSGFLEFFKDNGRYCSSNQAPRDIVKVLPMTNIDLRNCKPGDKLESANGKSAEYVGPFGNNIYPHCVKMINQPKAWFTDTGRFDSGRITNYDIVKVTHMTTQPKQIPPRGSDEFTQYCITVMTSSLAGANIETCMRERSNWSAVNVFAWDWANQNYRIVPAPPPKTRRYETREEFMLLVPTHGSFLVRRKSDMVVLTARIYIEGTDRFICSNPPNISADNFRNYEKSLDGGRSWIVCGVEES